MGSKYILVLLVLQVAQTCLGDTVIEKQSDLDLDGFTVSDRYFEAATGLPTVVPAPIRNSGSLGVWHFSEGNEGGVLVLTPETTLTEVSIKYYSSVDLSIYFQDKAMDEVEVKVPIQKTVGTEWVVYKFEPSRTELSSHPITFRIQFSKPTDTKNEYFLLDAVTLTGTQVTGTPGPTTESPGTGPTTPASSSAIAPSLITFLSLAIIKAFM